MGSSLGFMVYLALPLIFGEMDPNFWSFIINYGIAGFLSAIGFIFFCILIYRWQFFFSQYFSYLFRYVRNLDPQIPGHFCKYFSPEKFFCLSFSCWSYVKSHFLGDYLDCKTKTSRKIWYQLMNQKKKNLFPSFLFGIFPYCACLWSLSHFYIC